MTFIINPFVFAVAGPFNGHSTLTDNLLAYHKADTSGSYPDATGNGNNGTINGPTFTSGGKINGAYDYDGANDSIAIPQGVLTDMISADAFSIQIWGSFDNNGRYMYRGGAGGTHLGYGIAMDIMGDDKVRGFIGYSGSAPQCIGTTVLSASTFYHIVFTYDGTNMKMHINGSLETTTSAAAPTWSSTSTNNLGTDTSSFTDGILDETAFWDRALTNTEITDLYNTGSGLQY